MPVVERLCGDNNDGYLFCLADLCTPPPRDGPDARNYPLGVTLPAVLGATSACA